MSTNEEWTLRKVQQSDSVNDIILREDLFLKFKTENPEISRDGFFSEVGRLMGSGPFQNVVLYQKKGKRMVAGFSVTKQMMCLTPRFNQMRSSK